MAEETDGVVEEMNEKLRVGLMIAAQLAERMARHRERAMQLASERMGERAERLSVRFESERDAAVTSLSVVDQPAWWEQANVSDISDAWETARAWSGQDENAERAESTIAHEVYDRYGVDVRSPGGNARDVLTGLAEVAAERGNAERLRSDATRDAEVARLLMDQADEYDALARDAQGRLDAMESTPTFAVGEDGSIAAAPNVLDAEFAVGADGSIDRTAQQQHLDDVRQEVDHNRGMANTAHEGASEMFDRSNRAEHNAVQSDARADAAQSRVSAVTGSSTVPWDSAQRRDQFAASLSEKKVPAADVQARMVADISQGKPAGDAVKQPPRGAPKASKARAGVAQGKERQSTRTR
jgi:hypothetical protein